MNLYDRLYDESERAKVRFIGFTTENARFDFGIVYTNMFFGKPLVICMQTNRSTLISYEDLDDIAYLQKTFRVSNEVEAEHLSVFLRYHLPTQQTQIQY